MVDRNGLPDALLEVWKGLDDEQRQLVIATAQRLAESSVVEFDRQSGLTSSAKFLSSFTNELKSFHASRAETLGKRPFEHSMVRASVAAGWDAQLGSSATHPGADIILKGLGVSLKSEASQSIRPDLILISKLRESAATKSFTQTSEYQQFLQRVLLPHLHEYERVIMLRAFRPERLARLGLGSISSFPFTTVAEHAIASNNEIAYFLTEIPIELLRNVAHVREADIELRGSVGSAVVSVPSLVEGVTYTVFFDGSDNKIQIRNLPVNQCVNHAAWAIPITAD